jgi:hypothetical protein
MPSSAFSGSIGFPPPSVSCWDYVFREMTDVRCSAQHPFSERGNLSYSVSAPLMSRGGSDLSSTTKCDQNHITRTYKFGHALSSS